MKRLKIFQIIPNLGLGGAEVMVENLTEELNKDLFEIVVVCLYDHNSAITERLKKQNIRVLQLGKNKGIDVKLLYKLFKLFMDEKPDIIHTHLYSMSYAVPAAILSGVPIKLHTIHNIAEKEVGKWKRKINYFFYKHCKVTPVAISPIVKDSVIKEYGLKSDKVTMIYNGINLDKCINKQSGYSSKNNVNILHIGRFAKQKNHLGLIESFKIVNTKHPNTVLTLIGSGELEDLIKKRVKELELDNCVIFAGIKSNVYPFLSNADIFVLPSLWEGMPITLIEAMGTGLPIIATSVGGVPDVIENHRTGILVETDKEQIAKAIIRLVNDSSYREKLGKNAKEYSIRFSIQNMKEKYVTLYYSLYEKFSNKNGIRK